MRQDAKAKKPTKGMSADIKKIVLGFRSSAKEKSWSTAAYSNKMPASYKSPSSAIFVTIRWRTIAVCASFRFN